MSGPLADLKRLNSLDLPALKARVLEFLACRGAVAPEPRDEPATRGFGVAFDLAGRRFDLAFHSALSGLPMPRTVLSTRGGPALPLSVDLTPERGAFVWLAKRLWLRDDEVGNPDFDRRFIVRSADREATARWLTPSLRVSLGRLADANGGALLHLRVRPEGLFVEKHGVLDPADLPLYLDILALATGAITEG